MMRMMHKKWKQRISWLLLTTFLLTVSETVLFADSLKEAKEEKKKLEQSLEDAKSLVHTLKDSKAGIESKVTALDGKLTEISGNIVDLEQQIEEKDAEIAAVKENLQAARQTEETQYAQMKVRIQYMYENRRTTYLDYLLTAESFADFLNAVAYVRELTAYDREKLKEYEQTKEEITHLQLQLEEEKQTLEAMHTQVNEEKSAVEVLLSAKEEELSSVKTKIEDAQELADVYAAEIAAQEEVIAKIQAAEEKKRQEEAKRKAAAYSGGSFLWPCPSSTRVTSDYGNRISPTAGASSNHKGIDIGADYGADIVAAAAGTVVYAGYSNAAGNYVMLDHGGSVYTVYMHASSLCVAEGDTAAQGQVIAKVGSTGISTGNHLHFGVSENGSYVSPWKYLSH